MRRFFTGMDKKTFLEVSMEHYFFICIIKACNFIFQKQIECCWFSNNNLVLFINA